MNRFSDRLRKVMQLSNQEAQRLNHEYIGTEHLLVGLLKEGNGIACKILSKAFDLDLGKIRMKIEELVQPGPDMVTMGKLPQTPRAKKVLEYAMEEAKGSGYVGTDHLLLGLLREDEGVAAQVLTNLGVNLKEAQTVVKDFLHMDINEDRDLFHFNPITPNYETLVQAIQEAITESDNQALDKIRDILKGT